MFEFHVSRLSRDRYRFADALFSLSGNVVFADLSASREFAHRMNVVRDADRHPELAVHPGALNAMGLIDEALHAMVEQYRRQRDPRVIEDALAWFTKRLRPGALERTLLAFAEHFPTVSVYRGTQTASEWLAGTTAGTPHRAIALEELVLLWLANRNPAFHPFHELFHDEALSRLTSYTELTAALREYFETRPRFGPENQNLIDLLRAPALASPGSLEGQMAFIRDRWGSLLGDFIARMITALDILREEEAAIWMRFHPPAPAFGGGLSQGDSGPSAIPHFRHAEHEYERFTRDQDWMPRAVMIAKSVYVWLDQLSKTYQRSIHRLDQIPDEELDLLARRGFNGLWLIGVWERSQASRRIKQMCGNPEAAASAYSVHDYTVAEELGGEAACANLRERAWTRGIRMASDLVPNHTGIDSRWVIEHPDWFISLPYSPFPAYQFHGPDVASDGRVEIKIEDHYFDRTDAAVVFRRLDRWSGEARYVYHGNDGTSFPWNDTAQLNYLRADVREAVIQTILRVARQFPIIRFDAAMTLTKRHYQRLWFPEPGSGGAIPSRAEHGLTKAQFDAAMPVEFWREVVDRVAAEAPNTLLLAEAFWLMEGYFVRTLGMHRVYNSAFMNMLRDEENANYRSVIKNTLAFDPEVLKRFVNFLNNPDERTAVDQFGKGDKYFGVCTMMATLPGLPMFGHGQIEGFGERYGMEYRRAYHDEQPDPWLVARHEREISPLLHRRYLFAEVKDFLLYDFFTDQGHVNEDVFAYSNRAGQQRALVVFNNRYASTRGWVRMSCSYAEKSPGAKHIKQMTLGESFALKNESSAFVAFCDAFTGLEYLYQARDIAERGLNLELRAYQTHVFLDWRDLHEDATHPWGELCGVLAGRGVASLEDALRDLRLRPVHDALRTVVSLPMAEALADCASMKEGPARTARVESAQETLRHRAGVLLGEIERHIAANGVTLPAREAGLSPQDTVLESLEFTINAALKLSTLSRRSSQWPAEALSVLPLGETARPEAIMVWTGILAWVVMDAMGCLLASTMPETGAVHLFEVMRLRQPLAEAFAAAGAEGEEQWRAAARVRALLAHSSHPASVYGWIQDPDVAWLLGVHEHEGASYVVKEHFERVLWWMALPDLVDAAGSQSPGGGADIVREQVAARLKAVADSGYRVESLEDAVLPGASLVRPLL